MDSKPLRFIAVVHRLQNDHYGPRTTYLATAQCFFIRSLIVPIWRAIELGFSALID